MLRIDESEIGGAVVRRRINRGDAPAWLAGHVITREETLALRNLRALVEDERLRVLPRRAAATAAPIVPSLAGAAVKAHLVHVGRGLWDVIVGSKINDEPIAKEAAEALASRPA